jgi:hypothetical protein
MTKKLLFLFAILLCISCEFSSNHSKEWVYIEVETVVKKDTTYDFLYGQIYQSLIDKINNNENATGIFFITNTRFVNQDDLLQVYADGNDKGMLAFRIENIKSMVVYQKDPIHIYKEDQLHESAKALLNSMKSEVKLTN